MRKKIVRKTDYQSKLADLKSYYYQLEPHQQGLFIARFGYYEGVKKKFIDHAIIVCINTLEDNKLEQETEEPMRRKKADLKEVAEVKLTHSDAYHLLVGCTPKCLITDMKIDGEDMYYWQVNENSSKDRRWIWNGVRLKTHSVFKLLELYQRCIGAKIPIRRVGAAASKCNMNGCKEDATHQDDKQIPYCNVCKNMNIALRFNQLTDFTPLG